MLLDLTDHVRMVFQLKQVVKLHGVLTSIVKSGTGIMVIVKVQWVDQTNPMGQISLVQEKEQRNVSELQRFELGALTLVGVVAGTATPMALIEDPSGKGHTIKIGSLMGKHFGQVKQIRRGEIDVQEEFRDFTGKRIRSMKTLRLKPEEEIR